MTLWTTTSDKHIDWCQKAEHCQQGSKRDFKAHHTDNLDASRRINLSKAYNRLPSLQRTKANSLDMFFGINRGDNKTLN